MINSLSANMPFLVSIRATALENSMRSMIALNTALNDVFIKRSKYSKKIVWRGMYSFKRALNSALDVLRSMYIYKYIYISL